MIESKPGGTSEKSIAELEILVRSSRSGSPENGVQVRFREIASGERFEALTMPRAEPEWSFRKGPGGRGRFRRWPAFMSWVT